jgi:hypothetical protein
MQQILVLIFKSNFHLEMHILGPVLCGGVFCVLILSDLPTERILTP